MKINKVVVGPLEENCYILSLDGKALIIDPGAEFTKIKESVKNDEVIGILVTHNHFDHVGALLETKEEYQVPIYDYHNLKEETIEIGPFSFDVIFNPGHTEDSISFYFKNEKIMFVGDFIFKGSIGRCDLGGNFEDMKKSITKIKKYPNVLLYPGHGMETELDEEVKNNPYFALS